jgi:hypothetical protein
MSENSLPTRQAAAIEGRSARNRVTGKLRIALEAMIWEGLPRAKAAAKAGRGGFHVDKVTSVRSSNTAADKTCRATSSGRISLIAVSLLLSAALRAVSSRLAWFGRSDAWFSG